ncbi:hypothetical protein BD410DRAFT_841449 [Rickenella mellea]|uniref:Uncharacterized protein n=1 Tax=Rickenella mellea TaxID=50990 RepID=A0A4Y7PZ48_9AGAM|nr:hypothetical protein BD410DRAFT_841449 [Rickenella mellea]
MARKSLSANHHLYELSSMFWERELSSVNDTIARLLTKRDNLNGEVLAHKALLAPARLLLPELISEVFTHSVNCIPPAQGGLDNNKALCRFAIPSVNEAPLVLGQVCRLWREIALSTPSLWSTISIPRSFSIRGLREWISRAGSRNLSFSLLLGRTNTDISDLLASYQQRWSDVVVGFNSSQMESGRKFVETLSSEYHNLQTSEICAWGSHADDIPLVIGSAPHLRHLIVHDSSFKVTTLDNSPPLCLWEIDVRCAWWMLSKDWITLLRLSPAVQVVRTQVLNRVHYYEPHHDILTLLALKHMFIIVQYQDDQSFCVLERIFVPALEELSFRISLDRVPEFYRPQIKSLIHRSRPPLKVLRVWGGSYLPLIDIMECLPFLPLLSTLHLHELEGKLDGLIDALTGPMPPFNDDLPGCLCPELNVLYFNSTHYIPAQPVINMILSRSHSERSGLAHVTVRSCPEREVLADPRIIGCIENGLKFECN